MAAVVAKAFPVPSSVTFREIDLANGKLATLYCPIVFREAFLVSTEPREPCDQHGLPLLLESVVRRLSNAFR
jgi:hypothetical protein